MSTAPLRVGIVGAGANTRLRHIPGLRALPDVDIVAVCNRRPESTAQAAQELGIAQTYGHWEELVRAPDIDAVVIGTWPYLHCPITLAALDAGKHVLTEARMCMNAAEARQMLHASRHKPHLVTQIVPSPFGLKGHQVMVDLLAEGFLGEMREVLVVSLGDALADPTSLLSWRQDASLSGYNMLNLGILHETLLRWTPPPRRVMAQAHAFIPARIDPASGVRRPVETPDSVQVIGQLENNARVSYHLSGVAPVGQTSSITLVGSEGVLQYDLLSDQIRGARRGTGVRGRDLPEIPIPAEKEGSWQVEREFVQAIREGTPIRMTPFETGLSYMELTEAVALSAEQGTAMDLPLLDPDADED